MSDVIWTVGHGSRVLSLSPFTFLAADGPPRPWIVSPLE